MRPEVACSRRCGTVAPDAETALALGWEHLPPDWWECHACAKRDGELHRAFLESMDSASMAGNRE